ncbi:TonB-dependent receptor [Fulvivirgaceae bacterium BMA10]|uniref:TonB-dependent receptor n=1 Tax=Splendidivirga corallicola TaxID=3051826 RepID=A0ABT8KH13_9BACT|nr:TonB-dependent receptor [Fulvivirgaceae bacterium BMA10]
MKKIFTKSTLLLVVFFSFLCHHTRAQNTTVSGKILDEATSEPLVGVNILVKGTVLGTISDIDGNFNLSVSKAPPFTMQVSIVGYTPQEIEITNATTEGLEISMSEQTILGQEIVVSASRVEESVLESPVTVEKMDIIGIQQSAAPDFFDAISHIKGVTTSTGSLTFNAINTRGFATIANVRFVTLVDGMDISAPLLNFPTGNLVGISELDAESVELVPGAASALYGPNAFNGILFMNSKSPFEYQGLSAQVKVGATNSEAGDSNPLYSFSARYAKAFNNKFAFKLNFSLLDATDWTGNDYNTDRVIPGNQPGSPNFDGLNMYGDEARIQLNIASATGDPALAPLGDVDLRRTGWREEDLLANMDAKSIKADAALHYRVNDNVELLYNYRFGGGSSIYQGSAKFVLNDFTQQFHKLEAKGANFFVRGYVTLTDDGDSYNLDAMGAFVNERISPTATQWVPTYLQTYVLASQGYIPGVPAGNPTAAHAAARAQADASRNSMSASEIQQIIEDTRTANLNRDQNGAAFIEGSRLFHGEFNYNLKNQIDWAEIQVGGNVRRYSIFSDGTIFDEQQNSDGSFERVNISEWGAYTQISKRLADEKLKLTGSIRYDKNENFEGQFNPRFSAVYTFSQSHNIRASFQTGFRNPDTQAQFIWFPTSSGILVGSTESNAARYGIHNGGALDPTTLQPVDIDFVEPEELTAFEIGYKGVIADKILLDVNYYHNNYSGFIANRPVLSANAITRRGQTVTNAIGGINVLMNPYVNVPEDISSDGIGVGVTYSVGKGYTLSGNYNWADFTVDNQITEDFQAGFNTPEHKFSVNVSNRNVWNNIGFAVAYRWQDDFLWQSSFGEGEIPSFGVLDIQANYKIKSLKSIVKVGGTNLFSGDYRTNIGAGFVGPQYFISITFDEFLN